MAPACQFPVKLAVYKAAVLPTLLYGSETWAALAIHTHRLEMFHLRRIKKIKWWHRISNNDVLKRAKSTTIETMLRGNRLRWLGHVSRMKDNRIPKQFLFCDLASGTRDRSRRGKLWKDCAIAKDNLKSFNIDYNSWYSESQGRARWRKIAYSEQQLIKRAERRRKKRHEV